MGKEALNFLRYSLSLFLEYIEDS